VYIATPRMELIKKIKKSRYNYYPNDGLVCLIDNNCIKVATKRSKSFSLNVIRETLKNIENGFTGSDINTLHLLNFQSSRKSIYNHVFHCQAKSIEGKPVFHSFTTRNKKRNFHVQ